MILVRKKYIIFEGTHMKLSIFRANLLVLLFYGLLNAMGKTSRAKIAWFCAEAT